MTFEDGDRVNEFDIPSDYRNKLQEAVTAYGNTKSGSKKEVASIKKIIHVSNQLLTCLSMERKGELYSLPKNEE